MRAPRLLSQRSSLRPMRAAGLAVWIAIILALAAQCTWLHHARRVQRAPAMLLPAPAGPALDAFVLGEHAAASYLISLSLQSAEDQAAPASGFAALDYGHLSEWLSAALELDPVGHYPLLLASHVFSQVPDPARQRTMIDLVRLQAGKDLSTRWPWLAHASIMARHRLLDPHLALPLATDLARAPSSIAMPGWARQMAVFLHEDLGEHDAAQALLGGMLLSGTVHDANEARFLAHRLAELRDARNSSSPSTVRRVTGTTEARLGN